MYNNITYLYLYNLVFSFIFIFILDHYIKVFGFKGTWFQLHFAINFIIVLYTYQDVIDCLENPNNSTLQITPNTITASSMCFILHMYHTIFYDLRPIDIFHHYLFIFTSIPLYLMYMNKGAALVYFFSSGLPGGIDYLLLTLVKNNKINRLTEKNINSYLNVYIRMSGGYITSYIIFKDGLQNTTIYMYSNILLSCLIFYNSGYFGKLAIENNIENRLLSNH